MFLEKIRRYLLFLLVMIHGFHDVVCTTSLDSVLQNVDASLIGLNQRASLVSDTLSFEPPPPPPLPPQSTSTSSTSSMAMNRVHVTGIRTSAISHSMHLFVDSLDSLFNRNHRDRNVCKCFKNYVTGALPADREIMLRF